MMKPTTLIATMSTAVMVTALTMVTVALPVFAGADGEDEGKNGSAKNRSTKSGQIVFRRYFDADQTRGAVFVMNPDGSRARQITRPPRGWKDNVPAWSPDGRRITFERFKADESTSRVMVVNPDTGHTRAVVPCGVGRCVYAVDPYFTPDGSSIVYARTVAPPKVQDPPEWKLYTAIFVVGLDGRRSRQITSTPPRRRGEGPAYDSSDPTFSPNGKVLTFIRTRYRPSEHSAVFVQPADSPGKARRITPWRLNCQDRPTFSPDGGRVLFRCQPRGEEGPSNLYWIRPDGRGLRQVTHASADKQYLGSSFSPGFRQKRGWISVGRTGGVGKARNADVLRILVEGGTVVRTWNLTRSEKWDSAPGWGTHPPMP